MTRHHSDADAPGGRAAAVAAAAPALTPIRRGPLYEEVLARLRAWIAQRALAPGDRLPPERELARQLAVSRASVRQALTVMRVRGLIEIRHGNGTYLLRNVDDVVPPISAEVARRHPEFAHVSEVRNVLEELAAELAARRHTRSHVADMSRALDRMTAEIAAGEPGIEGDQAFHHAVTDAARNDVLSAMMHNLQDAARRIAQASLSRPGQPPRSLATHREILAAIVRRDAEEASRLMREHLEITGELQR